MPLIIITGFPCSGKTHRTEQLVSEFYSRISSSSARIGSTPHPRSILHIPSQHSTHSSLSLSSSIDSSNARNTIYNSAGLEKTARAAEFSAIKRALGKDVIVITDSLNYIKGYRYQLWCEAKAAGTRCCVVHVAAREDECTRWNEIRLKAAQGDDGGEDGGGQNGDGGTAQDGKKVLVATTTPAASSFGELMPESHTAIYGDRLAGEESISSRAWIDRRLDGDGKPADDMLTLKSLSLQNESLGPRLGDTNSIGTFDGPAALTNSSPTPSSENPAPPLPSDLPPPSPPYEPQTLNSLIMRYEPPSPFSRWDTPLFTVPSSDTPPPFDAIWNAIFPLPAPKPTKKPANRGDVTSQDSDVVKPHAATVLPASTSAEALQILEKVTGDMTTQILSWNKSHNADNEGGTVRIRVPATTSGETDLNNTSNSVMVDLDINIPPGTVLTQPMLQRMRRRFIQIQRGSIAHGQGHAHGRKGVAEAFARFLDGELGDG